MDSQVIVSGARPNEYEFSIAATVGVQRAWFWDARFLIVRHLNTGASRRAWFRLWLFCSKPTELQVGAGPKEDKVQYYF